MYFGFVSQYDTCQLSRNLHIFILMPYKNLHIDIFSVEKLTYLYQFFFFVIDFIENILYICVV